MELVRARFQVDITLVLVVSRGGDLTPTPSNLFNFPCGAGATASLSSYNTDVALRIFFSFFFFSPEGFSV